MAALSAALVLVAGGSAVRQLQVNRQLTDALGLARDAQAKADQRAEFFLGQHARALERIGRLDLLNEAYVDVLKTDTGNDERARRRRADVLTRMGVAFVSQNRHEESIAPLRQALTLATSLPAGHDRDLLMARAASALARVVAETRSFDEATAILSKVEHGLDPGNPGSAEALAEIAEGYTDLGLTSVFSHPDVRRRAEEAVRYRRLVLRRNPEDPDAALKLAGALQAEGAVLSHEGRYLTATNPGAEATTALKEARRRFEEALTFARRMTAIPPVDAEWELHVADNLGWIAEVTSLLDPESAPDSFRLLMDQRDIVMRAVTRDPLDWRCRSSLSSIYDRIANALAARNDSKGEDEYRRLHEEIVTEINRQAPAERKWMLISMDASLALGRWHLSRGRPDDADRQFGIAWNYAKRLFQMRPDHQTDRKGFRDVEQDIRETWARVNDIGRVRALLDDGLSFVRERAAAGGPATDEYHWMTAHFERRNADFCRERGDLDAMLKFNLSALSTRVRLLRERAGPAVQDPYAVPGSFLHSERSHLLRREVGEALELGRQALEIWKECAQLAPNPNDYWAEAILIASRAGREAGGALAESARQLAANALASMYGVAAQTGDPDAQDATPPPAYQPRPEQESKFREATSRNIAELTRLAAPAFPDGITP